MYNVNYYQFCDNSWRFIDWIQAVGVFCSLIALWFIWRQREERKAEIVFKAMENALMRYPDKIEGLEFAQCLGTIIGCYEIIIHLNQEITNYAFARNKVVDIILYTCERWVNKKNLQAEYDRLDKNLNLDQKGNNSHSQLYAIIEHKDKINEILKWRNETIDKFEGKPNDTTKNK